MSRQPPTDAALPSAARLQQIIASQTARIRLLRGHHVRLQLQQRERQAAIAELDSHANRLSAEASASARTADVLKLIAAAKTPSSGHELRAAVFDIVHSLGWFITPPSGPGDGGEKPAEPRLVSSNPAARQAGDVAVPHRPAVTSAVAYDLYEHTLPVRQSYVVSAPSSGCTALESLHGYIFHPSYARLQPAGSVLAPGNAWTVPADAVLCTGTSEASSTGASSSAPASTGHSACPGPPLCTCVHADGLAAWRGGEALLTSAEEMVHAYTAALDTMLAARAEAGVADNPSAHGDDDADMNGGDASGTGPGPGTGRGRGPDPATSPTEAGGTSSVLDVDITQIAAYLTDKEQSALAKASAVFDVASSGDVADGLALAGAASAGGAAGGGVGPGTHSSAAMERAARICAVLTMTAKLRRRVEGLPEDTQVQFVMAAGRRARAVQGSSSRGVVEAGAAPEARATDLTSPSAGGMPARSTVEAVDRVEARWRVLRTALGHAHTATAGPGTSGSGAKANSAGAKAKADQRHALAEALIATVVGLASARLPGHMSTGSNTVRSEAARPYPQHPSLWTPVIVSTPAAAGAQPSTQATLAPLMTAAFSIRHGTLKSALESLGLRLPYAWLKPLATHYKNRQRGKRKRHGKGKHGQTIEDTTGSGNAAVGASGQGMAGVKRAAPGTGTALGAAGPSVLAQPLQPTKKPRRALEIPVDPMAPVANAVAANAPATSVRVAELTALSSTTSSAASDAPVLTGQSPTSSSNITGMDVIPLPSYQEDEWEIDHRPGAQEAAAGGTGGAGRAGAAAGATHEDEQLEDEEGASLDQGMRTIQSGDDVTSAEAREMSALVAARAAQVGSNHRISQAKAERVLRAVTRRTPAAAAEAAALGHAGAAAMPSAGPDAGQSAHSGLPGSSGPASTGAGQGPSTSSSAPSGLGRYHDSTAPSAAGAGASTDGAGPPAALVDWYRVVQAGDVSTPLPAGLSGQTALDAALYQALALCRTSALPITQEADGGTVGPVRVLSSSMTEPHTEDEAGPAANASKDLTLAHALACPPAVLCKAYMPRESAAAGMDTSSARGQAVDVLQRAVTTSAPHAPGSGLLLARLQTLQRSTTNTSSTVAGGAPSVVPVVATPVIAVGPAQSLSTWTTGAFSPGQVSNASTIVTTLSSDPDVLMAQVSSAVASAATAQEAHDICVAAARHVASRVPGQTTVSAGMPDASDITATDWTMAWYAVRLALTGWCVLLQAGQRSAVTSSIVGFIREWNGDQNADSSKHTLPAPHLAWLVSAVVHLACTGVLPEIEQVMGLVGTTALRTVPCPAAPVADLAAAVHGVSMLLHMLPQIQPNVGPAGIWAIQAQYAPVLLMASRGLRVDGAQTLAATMDIQPAAHHLAERLWYLHADSQDYAVPPLLTYARLCWTAKLASEDNTMASKVLLDTLLWPFSGKGCDSSGAASTATDAAQLLLGAVSLQPALLFMLEQASMTSSGSASASAQPWLRAGMQPLDLCGRVAFLYLQALAGKIGLQQAKAGITQLLEFNSDGSAQPLPPLDVDATLQHASDALEVWASATFGHDDTAHSYGQLWHDMVGDQGHAMEQCAFSLLSLPLLVLLVQSWAWIARLKASGRGDTRHLVINVMLDLSLKRALTCVRAALNTATAAVMCDVGTPGSGSGQLDRPVMCPHSPAVLAEALLQLQYTGVAIARADLDRAQGSSGRPIGHRIAAVSDSAPWHLAAIDSLLCTTTASSSEPALASVSAMAPGRGHADGVQTAVKDLQRAVDAAVGTSTSLALQLAPLAYLRPGVSPFQARVAAWLAAMPPAEGATARLAALPWQWSTATTSFGSAAHQQGGRPGDGPAAAAPVTVPDPLDLSHRSAMLQLLSSDRHVVGLLGQRQAQGTSPPGAGGQAPDAVHRPSPCSSTPAYDVRGGPWPGPAPSLLAALHGHLSAALVVAGGDGEAALTAGTAGASDTAAGAAHAAARRICQVVDSASSNGSLPDTFNLVALRYHARTGHPLAQAALQAALALSNGPDGMPGPLRPALPMMSHPVVPGCILACMLRPLDSSGTTLIPTPIGQPRHGLVHLVSGDGGPSSVGQRGQLVAPKAGTGAASSLRREQLWLLLGRCGSESAVERLMALWLDEQLCLSPPVRAAMAAGTWLTACPLSARAWRAFSGVQRLHVASALQNIADAKAPTGASSTGQHEPAAADAAARAVGAQLRHAAEAAGVAL